MSSLQRSFDDPGCPSPARGALVAMGDVMRRELELVRLLRYRASAVEAPELESVRQQLVGLDSRIRWAITALEREDGLRAVDALESALEVTDDAVRLIAARQ